MVPRLEPLNKRSAVAGLGSLQSMGLAHCRQFDTHEAPYALACACAGPCLTSLDVDGWEALTDLGCEALANCPTLIQLTLDGANLSDAVLAICATHLPALEVGRSSKFAYRKHSNFRNKQKESTDLINHLGSSRSLGLLLFSGDAE